MHLENWTLLIIDAIYEKATVKEKLLINFLLKGNKYNFVKISSIESA